MTHRGRMLSFGRIVDVEAPEQASPRPICWHPPRSLLSESIWHCQIGRVRQVWGKIWSTAEFPVRACADDDASRGAPCLCAGRSKSLGMRFPDARRQAGSGDRRMELGAGMRASYGHDSSSLIGRRSLHVVRDTCQRTQITRTGISKRERRILRCDQWTRTPTHLDGTPDLSLPDLLILTCQIGFEGR